MAANDTQVAGTHYAAPIQHWDYVEANNLNYFEGQITKYVTRCRKKGQCIQDLKKARHFLDKYIELQEAAEKQAAFVGMGIAPDPHVIMSGTERFESEVGASRRAEAEIIASRKREGGA